MGKLETTTELRARIYWLIFCKSQQLGAPRAEKMTSKKQLWSICQKSDIYYKNYDSFGVNGGSFA